MSRLIQKYIIPHEGNDNKPHLLRETGVLVLSYIIVLAFFGSLLQSKLITSPQFSAEVLPAVLIDLANKDRAQNDLASLTYSPTLAAAAKLKAQDMAAYEYFAHTSPIDSSKTPWYWFNQAGYSFTAAGENLAIDFSDSGAVNEAWMESPGHRANILNAKFTEIGIALEQGEYEGHPTTFVVQLFGKPRAVSATPVPAVAAAPKPKPVPVPAPAPKPASIVAIATPSTSPTVAGESKTKQVLAEQETRPEPVKPPSTKLVTLAEDEKFIAVQELSTTARPELIEDAPSNPSTSTSSTTVKYANWADRLLSSPRKTLEYSYIALSGLILIVILLMINKEIERHHLKHIFYGLALLVLMYVLLSASKAILVGEVLIK